MISITLLRTVRTLEEEYGRIRFYGKKFYYDGLSSVFMKYLQSGVTGPDHKQYRPEHGLKFLKSIKNHFSDATLHAAEFSDAG